MKLSRVHGRFIVPLITGLLAISARAQVTNWVAFNDHTPGSTAGWATHPNATTYNMRGVAGGNAGTVLSGNLKNIDTGADVGAVFASSAVGSPNDLGSMAYPNANTDAYNLFNGKVDLGNSQSGIGVRSAAGITTTLTFSNLDPSKRYVLKGTSVRGNNYAGRWTLCTLDGTEGFTEDHSAAGIYTAANYPAGGMTTGQAAYQSGENRTGAVVGWKDINPGPDGTFTVKCEQWAINPLPNGSAPDTANYGYALCAIMLAEVVIDQSPVGITGQPQSITVAERDRVSLSLIATGAPQTIQWYRRDGGAGSFVEIPGAFSSTYIIPSAAYPADNGAQFRAVVSNSFNSVTSSIATVTVLPDTVVPTVVSVVGDPDPSLIHISFSENIEPSSVDVLNISLVDRSHNPLPGYETLSYVVTNGSNVIITTTPRVVGQNYALFISAVQDLGNAHNTMVETNVDVRVRMQLVGFDTDNEWKYDSANGDRFGTGWETVGFDDSAWPSGPAGLGVDASANGVPIRTPIPYNADSAPAYFRRHFSLPADPRTVTLTLRDVVEDGAVYYINGQEAYRHNVAAGTLTFATRSAAGQADPTPIQGPFTLPTTNLVEGDNVIAVVVIQSGATSSDVELAVELMAEFATYSTGVPSVEVQPQSITVNEGQTAALSALVGGASPLSLEWRKGTPPGGTPVAGVNSATLSFSPARPGDSGDYYLHVSNNLGSTNTAVAHLTVIADVTAPTVLYAWAMTNGTQILLGLSEPLDPSTIDVLNFEFSPALGVNVAALTNGTNILLTVDPMSPQTSYSLHVLAGMTDTSQAANPLAEVTIPVWIPVTAVPLVDYEWRWLGDGTDPGAGWQLASFNDSAWQLGTNLFEAKRGTIPVELEPLLRTSMNVSNVANTTNVFTYYFRTHFNWQGSGAAALQIAHYIDDGAVVYLNGQQIYEIGMTNPAPIPYLATASRSVGDATYEGPFLLPLAPLTVGDNLLAVEVHQVNGTSSDATMSVGLDVLVTSFGASGPRLTVGFDTASGKVVVTWPSGTLQETSSLEGAGTVWTDVAGSPTSPYMVTPAGSAKFYRVR